MITDKERIVTLEVKVESTDESIKDHEQRIDTLEKALVSLVHEVKLIRYALFVLATSSTIPPVTIFVKSLIGL